MRQGLQTDGSFRNTASHLTADLNHRFRSYDRLIGSNLKNGLNLDYFLLATNRQLQELSILQSHKNPRI